MKSAERYRNMKDDESFPEVEDVPYMPEVYKISKVRIVG